jgi:hypothetical protein
MESDIFASSRFSYFFVEPPLNKNELRCFRSRSEKTQRLCAPPPKFTPKEQAETPGFQH